MNEQKNTYTILENILRAGYELGAEPKTVRRFLSAGGGGLRKAVNRWQRFCAYWKE